MSTNNTTIEHLHRRAVAEFIGRVTDLREHDWSTLTGCDGWTVRDVVNHVVAGNREVAPVLAGRRGTEVEGISGDMLSEGVGLQIVQQAGIAATDAVEQTGSLEGVKYPRHGPFPGDVYAWQRFAENLIHGWDIADATDRNIDLAPDLVEACTSFFDSAEDAYRQAGFVGPAVPVPADTSPQTRLLARFGRAT